MLACMEIALQIYNPFTFRVKNGRITLPAGLVYEADIPEHPGLEDKLKHTKNSLGFRGPEPNDSFRMKIICMGGSTTECFYLSDGRDWPSVLSARISGEMPGIWVNNAGMDGQSTYGHLKLLKQHVLRMKPDLILFMCGLNDMSLDTAGRFDKTGSTLGSWYDALELPSVISNLSRLGKAKKVGLNHRFINSLRNEPKLIMNDSQLKARLIAEQYYLGGYRNRLMELISLCRTNNIQPVFVAQSILYSDESDLFTGEYLGNLRTGVINGKARGLIIKMYNKVTFDVCSEQKIPFINLPARMPKDSRFYYDGYHFTNEGSEMAGEMIARELLSENILKKHGN